ncbi:Phosphoenolpyruvate-dependent sugar phosphotransferase system, EIIA 2 [Oenococcus oeni]|uniref:Ascorbate-specific PTS system EIIA component n=1 Tax=Oenococcus oeni TaxID=1247 RepID=A0A3S7HEG9_OENOE|nr:PTS sugar transporter subunit IIA [Oenococcus oeni]AVI94620.1 transcriptional antiterminator [Oenococcus oeni]KGH88930.1 transcriptional antiterminator [Oenococcus oeni S12]OIK85235.1 transcriptional antiterminator [Oenococcus oeni]OIL08418.1 transcriptional antiterminator [Oenococcus oeni]OIL11303.1 transcriptional antiterminator [Oenococcus oeni]
MKTIPEISADEIQLKIHANNWKEAIRLAADPLLKNGNITENYIQNMIDSVNKLGPYIVIAPGLALGHARPSSAVKKTGFAIASLDEPIKFGSKDNDPVDLVVILASTSDTDHISLLQKIVMYLNDQKNLDFLRKITTDDAAKEVAEQINGGNDNADN